jgi:hypothetical protein
VKKGRHRRYEEARELKRQQGGDDIESLMERLDDDPFERLKLSSTDSDETDIEAATEDDD